MIDSKKWFALLGPPGSGKGTQINLLSQDPNFKSVLWVGIGNLLRQEIKLKTSLGKSISDVMDHGEFPSLSCIQTVLNAFLEKNNVYSTIFFDGFPRYQEQIHFIHDLALQKNAVLEKVFLLEVPQSILKQRIRLRRLCSQCETPYNKNMGLDFCPTCHTKLVFRKDDVPEIFEHRLALFHKFQTPINDYYDQKKILERIDGAKPPEIIFQNIKNILKSCLEKEF
jgi:adenylate kinase